MFDCMLGILYEKAIQTPVKKSLLLERARLVLCQAIRVGVESKWSVVELISKLSAALVYSAYHWLQIFWWWDQSFLSSRSWDLGTDEIPGNCLWLKAEPPVLET